MKRSFCEGRESYRLSLSSPVPSGSHPSLESSLLAVTDRVGRAEGWQLLFGLLSGVRVGRA